MSFEQPSLPAPPPPGLPGPEQPAHQECLGPGVRHPLVLQASCAVSGPWGLEKEVWQNTLSLSQGLQAPGEGGTGVGGSHQSPRRKQCVLPPPDV